MKHKYECENHMLMTYRYAYSIHNINMYTGVDLYENDLEVPQNRFDSTIN